MIHIGDVVGVGYIPKDRVLFYTRNGISTAVLTDVKADTLRGMIVATKHVSISVNFGDREFLSLVRAPRDVLSV